MLTKKQLADITRLQKAKQEKFRSVPKLGMTIEYLGKKFTVYRNVFWPYDDSIPLVQNFVIKPGESVLDVGTGCGVIAVFAAAKGAGRVVAVDINPAAVRSAKVNVRAHGFAGIIDVRLSNLFAAVRADETFDVIIANLPLRNKTAEDVVESSFWDSAFRSHEKFFADVGRHLNSNGRVYMTQANYGAIEEMKQLVKLSGFNIKLIGSKQMPQRDPRIFYAFALRKK